MLSLVCTVVQPKDCESGNHSNSTNSFSDLIKIKKNKSSRTHHKKKHTQKKHKL